MLLPQGFFFDDCNFVRSGLIDLQEGLFRNAGGAGGYRSVAAHAEPDVYFMRFNTTDAYPSDYYVRHYGFPIRCVAL